MTTAEIPVAELRERASQITPGRTVATAILWVIVGTGWVLGASWRLLVFLSLVAWHKGLVTGALALQYGTLRGRGLTEAQIEARAEARAEAKSGK